MTIGWTKLREEPIQAGFRAVVRRTFRQPNTAVPHYLSGQIVSNGIMIGLGTNGKLAITALGSATDVIIDCQAIMYGNPPHAARLFWGDGYAGRGCVGYRGHDLRRRGRRAPPSPPAPC